MLKRAHKPPFPEMLTSRPGPTATAAATVQMGYMFRFGQDGPDIRYKCDFD